ncbi:related to Cyclohexadienyl dehydratase [Ramularia collo-cygni]|uniref:Related to Cyclohexadienyl dehydratase n=1 Tax=Ramularia collo-cygni TaxID=112498 RepID=A0A2D3V7J9_9PEZI|nr:related to Cyclohexadienyl dehydratase [Ramularia collo-cygni]CZT18534.1 related to Cyclohexadienyl dehydratase [Ramularia collo-cygni]
MMKVAHVGLIAPLVCLAFGNENGYGYGYGWKEPSPSLSYANVTSLLDTIITRGYLRVGTTGDYKPFSYKVADATALPNGTSFNTTYIGGDIDMAQALSNALSLPSPPVFVPSVWANLTKDVAADQFDIAMGGVSITLPRAKTAFFSTSMQRVGKTGCIRCADKEKYTDFESLDVSGVKIAANPGGTNEAFDRANFQNAEIVIVEDNNAVYQAVIDGTADAMVSDKIEVELQVNLRNGSLCMVNEEPWTFEELGYLLPRDQAWKNFVDLWVRNQVEGGAWNETLGKWMAYKWPAV